VRRGLGEVAAGGEPRALEHRRDLAAHQGDLGGALAVGAGGEQAQEAVLARHPARGVEALDADVVHVARPVHGGARVGLADHQRLGRVRHGMRLARQRGGRRGLGGDPQHAQVGAGVEVQPVAPALLDEAVAAVAEQHEVVVRQPAQEGERLVARGSRRGAGFEFGGGLGQAGAHRRPVVHRGAHVAQRLREAGGQRLARRRIEYPIDLDVHHRLVRAARFAARRQGRERAASVALDVEQRVQDEVQPQALAVDLHDHRVDQEGHVVVDDLDDGMARLPAVLA